MTDGRHRAERAQEGLGPFRPEPGYVVQGTSRAPLACAPLIADSHSVRLIAHALHEEQALAGPRQDDGLAPIGQPQFLEPLGKTDDSHPRHLALSKGVHRHPDLRLSAVDDEERWCVGEGTPSLASIVEHRPEASQDDLAHSREVVVGTLVGDRESAVLPRSGRTILEDHERGDDSLASEVRDVDRLDSQRGSLHAERILDLLQRLAAGREVTRASRLVQREALLSVRLSRRQEILLGAPLRHSDVHVCSALPSEPVLDSFVDSRGYEDFRRTLAGLVHKTHEQSADQDRLVDVLHPLHDVAALPSNPPVADMEDLERHLEIVRTHADDIGIDGFIEHDRVALHCPLEGSEVVPQPGSALVILGRGSVVHLSREPTLEFLGSSTHEGTKILRNAAVFFRGDPADTGG